LACSFDGSLLRLGDANALKKLLGGFIGAAFTLGEFGSGG